MRGFTHAELSKKIDIARTSYTNIENGKKNPSLAVAIRIKNILKYKNDNIFNNENISK
ncbi:helix-turn-helix transcriptional regulator [Alkaliphilus sp. B6464]|uniref:helix-turn-helix transcriptional regulator n=1 Tax=Alkaliphilus sp. B6464 TaxID=2731219 RepID=UPI001BA7883A|nr:helix-turn-helix domain-containing protein [Alkaliphilus sp. B6464]